MNNGFHMFILRGDKGKGFHVHWEKRIYGSSHVRIKAIWFLFPNLDSLYKWDLAVPLRCGWKSGES